MVSGKIQSLSQLLDPSVVAGKGYGQYFKKNEYGCVPIKLYLPVLSFFLSLSCNSLKNIDLNNSHQVKPSWDDQQPKKPKLGLKTDTQFLKRQHDFSDVSENTYI